MPREESAAHISCKAAAQDGAAGAAGSTEDMIQTIRDHHHWGGAAGINRRPLLCLLP
jgi:hypothetical protein